MAEKTQKRRPDPASAEGGGGRPGREAGGRRRCRSRQGFSRRTAPRRSFPAALLRGTGVRPCLRVGPGVVRLPRPGGTRAASALSLELPPPPLPAPSVKIAPGAVVCVESEIRGDVTIGPRTVIHPKARIIAEAGPIVIGEGNLIEEQALIINAHPDNITPDTEDPEPKPMIIGTNNVFEVGCYSQAMKMGDNNVIESKAYVGRNVILTSGCIVGACCNLNTYEVVPENTVIYGTDCLRRVQSERPQVLEPPFLKSSFRGC
nr:dynactin subunit 6 [Manis javanica]